MFILNTLYLHLKMIRIAVDATDQSRRTKAWSCEEASGLRTTEEARIVEESICMTRIGRGSLNAPTLAQIAGTRQGHKNVD